jgi:branched-chain amino acid transport system substrate-binding protein
MLIQHRSKIISGLAAVAAMALVFAACGGSSSSSSPTTSVSSAQVPKGTPIVVGALGDLSGNAFTPAEADLSATPRAWVDWTNAHGGINGHPVKLDIINDEGDAGQAVAAAHQLVADKVVAIVYDEDIGIELGYTSYLEQQGIPVVGGKDYDKIWEQDPDLFPTMTTLSAMGFADDYAAHYAGAKTVAEVYCSEEASCKQAIQAQQAAAPATDIKDVVISAVSSSSANYASQCDEMLASHPQALYFSDDAPPIEQMATDCAQQGFKGFWVLPYADDGELSIPALSKFSIGGELSLPYFARLPQTEDFDAAMTKYAPGVQLRSNSIRIWAAFDVFKRALEQNPNVKPSPQAVKAGLYKLGGFDDNGLTPPLTYVSGKPTVVRCFILWGIKDGKFELPEGDTYRCAP